MAHRMLKLKNVRGFSSPRVTQQTDPDEIWEVSVDHGNTLARQIWPSSTTGSGYRSPKVHNFVKFSGNATVFASQGRQYVKFGMEEYTVGTLLHVKFDLYLAKRWVQNPQILFFEIHVFQRFLPRKMNLSFPLLSSLSSLHTPSFSSFSHSLPLP